MSYDFCIEVDTGGSEPHRIEPYFDGRCGNYTSNVSWMWRACLTAALDVVPDARRWIAAAAKAYNAAGRTGIYPLPGGGYSKPGPICEADTLALRDLHGQRCADLLPLLVAAVEWGAENIDELRVGNPENGWGDADGALTYLRDIRSMCEAHPIGRLDISS